MSLQVKYMDVPEGAQEMAAYGGDRGQLFSQPRQLAEGVVDVPWATLEPGGWKLDGSQKLLPDQPGQMGWWSRERSDAAGMFQDPPTITVTFPQMYAASGLTFRFSPSTGQWCSCVDLLWYRGETLLDQTTEYPTAADWVLYHPVEDFDRVVIRLRQTNLPGQFAKLQQLQIGRVMVFMGDELVKVRLLQESDPALCSLTVDTLTVEIRDRKGRVLQPRRDQRVHLYRNGIQLATHYITDAQRQSRHNYRLRCQSAVGRLEDTFLGDVYDRYPLETLLGEVLGEFPFGVDAAFAGRTLTGYLPVCTRRQALQQIAFAVGAAVITLGGGQILLVPPEDRVSGGFTAGRIFAGGELRQEAPVTAVELFIHSYDPGDEEKVLLKETEVSGEGELFVFSEPYYGYQITGGSITGSSANWIRITAHGPVTLTAQKYRHTVSVSRRELPRTTEKGNVITVEKATLISRDNADAALQRLYDYYRMRDLLIQDVVVAEETVGQLVDSLNPWGDRVTGYITAMESTFTDAGHTANVQIRCREVQV